MLVSGLVVAFLLFDAVIHLLNIDVVKRSMTDLGYSTRLSLAIGVIELGCVVLHAIRRTSILGAVLLTGFLGGAVATNLRVEKPLLSTTLFPVYVAVAMWVGVYLRDAELRRVVHRMLVGHSRELADVQPPAGVLLEH
jgi:hypothetical protein